MFGFGLRFCLMVVICLFVCVSIACVIVMLSVCLNRFIFWFVCCFAV